MNAMNLHRPRLCLKRTNMKLLLSMLMTACVATMLAQSNTQSIRGQILDKESQQPLIGASVVIEKTIPMLGTSTDVDGKFVIENVPVGRHTIVISYLGYEAAVVPHVQIVSGKQFVLNVELIESTVKLDEVVVKAHSDPSAASNEMAVVSARGFSVEETGRYAASFFDPARMAKNYAGVSVAGGSSDLFNEIIVRGNSPRGILWRLEGIEIPNPNHFSELGNTGGGISMLSSSTLSYSEFYTGAFPAEFGNASSGVFDLNLRKGNSEKREYAVMAGFLGLEAAAEGPFSKNSDASYLINFRYSTLSILEAIGLSPVSDALPKYGDISFNFYLPTKNAGHFNLFGLGGSNSAYNDPPADSTQWETSSDEEGFDDRQQTGTIGLVHKYIFNNNSYIRTVVSASQEKYDGEGYMLDPENDYAVVPYYRDYFKMNTFRANSTYTKKVDARNSFKLGLIGSYSAFDFFSQERDEDAEEMVVYLQNDGTSSQFNAFGQWKHRFDEAWTVTGGVHFNYFGLNSTYSIEPRAALKWDASARHSLSFAVGIHSKPEHPTFYYGGGEFNLPGSEKPNFYREYTKSLHTVLGYNWIVSKDLKVRAEAYYQHLYDVPVQDDLTKKGSMINAAEVWDYIYAGATVNEGLGRNIGLDLTIEKNYSRNYYLLFTGSIFDSKFTTLAGEWFNTRYSSKYQVNLLGGKEWKMGSDKDNILGVNMKLVFNGGERTTPIDLDASIAKGETVRLDDQLFSQSIGAYYRLDLGISYKINKKKSTHTISLDVQNATNRLNPFYNYYDDKTQSIDYEYHTGLFPVLNYRIEF